jgi:RimJ/RimL family protein N-acetyltransferase
LRYVDSPRLRLIAANARLVSIDLEGHRALAEALETIVPDNWPPELYDRPAMTYALQQLADPGEQGWSFWYLQSRSPEAEQLIGLCGFKGRPDSRGRVEIAYSVLNQFRGRGFAVEAVQALVRWAFTHPGVHEVCAETLPYLSQSIRVLEKCGFSRAGAGSEHGVIRFALSRSSLR